MEHRTFGEYIELKEETSPTEILEAVNLLVNRMLDRIQYEQAKTGKPLYVGGDVSRIPHIWIDPDRPNQILSELNLRDTPGEQGTWVDDRFVKFKDITP